MLMYMCMLNKRTQILLEKDMWNKLNKLAKSKKTSIGQLIREAVDVRLKEEKVELGGQGVINAILKRRQIGRAHV